MSHVLVVLSGGQDSTTCLYWAISQFSTIHTITFDYGQRHRLEIESAQKIAQLANVPNTLIPINTFPHLGSNALTTSTESVRSDLNSETSLPNTFVPGRNLIFLTFAAAFAYPLGIRDLVTGVCETDYSGYPDCRKATIDSLSQTISLGMDATFQIHTPLMHLSKEETVQMAQEVGAMEALKWSHTCYNGQFPPCGNCPACQLRQKGFELAGIPDPLLERHK